MDKDVRDLWKAYAAHRRPADRDRLIVMYQPFVRAVAFGVHSKLPPGCPDVDDLVSVGMISLIKHCLDRFDVERGWQFETFAGRRIRGAMLDELRELDWVPRLVRAKQASLQRATDVLHLELGRDPTEAELQKRLKLNAIDFAALMSEGNIVSVISMERQVGEYDKFDVRYIRDLLIDPRQIDPTLARSTRPCRSID
jgi:RNA polymerase sigma factor for flagellar operon FliA